MRCGLFCASIALFAALTACGGDDTVTHAKSTSGAGDAGVGGNGGEGGGGSGGGSAVAGAVKVSGTIVDFEKGTDVQGSISLSTVGLTPPPTTSIMGAKFELSGVAPFSVFDLLTGAPPDYRSTYNIATEVKDKDVTGVNAEVVSESFLKSLATAFGVVSVPDTGIVLALAVDETGKPKAGVPATAFTLNDKPPPLLPRFLDASKKPAPTLAATSDSGVVVFYNVPTGTVTLGAAAASGVTITSTTSPSSANAVTLVKATVTMGTPTLPKNVSFSRDVVPIFTRRGCKACHSGNAPGADLGNLALNGSDNSIYKELTQEISVNFHTTRVNLKEPAKSLVLTMPSYEPVPDAHPNVTFTSTADPDYQILLSWITAGAKQN